MKDLITLLDSQITEANTADSVISEQRQRNHRYWSLQPLGNEVEGRSHYIDPSVFESVEDKKAVYSETFLSSRQVVRFSGTNADEAAAKTAYVQKVLKANRYTSLLTDFWHDAFVAKRGTVWVDWRRNRETVSMQLTGHPSHIVNQQLQQLGQITNINKEGLQSYPIPSIGPQQFVYSGTLEVEIDKSHISLDLIQPEWVYRDPNQAYAADAGWNAARMDMTRLSLIDWGFDPNQVARLQRVSQGTTAEDAARKAGQGGNQDAQGTDDHETVTVYKTRAWLSPDDFAAQTELLESFQPETGAAIYEIYWSSSAREVLYWNDGTPAIRVLDSMDVYEWSEFKIAHAADGMCTADVEAHQQKAASGLKRGVMDYMNITVNPRWEVNPDAYRDLRDLYDNAIGSTLETDGGPVGINVKALDQPQLSPVVFGVIQMLDRDSEARKGQSELSTGMNMGAVNNQNASDMIERLSNAGMRRVAMGARSFANDFYAPLMQCIVKLAKKYDKSQTAIEAGGRQVVVSPAQWSDDYEMDIEVALTPQEAQEMTVKLIGIDSRMSADPEIKPLYGLKQKHSLYDTVYELMGIKDSTRFLASPDSPEVQQALQAAQQQAQEQMQRAQALEGFHTQVLKDQLDLAWASLNNRVMDTREDNDREDRKLIADNLFRAKELQIEQQQQRPVASH